MKVLVLLNVLMMTNFLCAQEENIVHLSLSETEKVFPDYKNNSYTNKYYDDKNRLKAVIDFNLKNQRNGTATWYFPDGQLHYEGNYKNDLKNGMHISYYKGGQIKSSSRYKNGALHRYSKTFYESGQVWTCIKYKKGKPVGTFKRFYPNGLLEFTYKIKAEQVGKKYIYDENGNPKNGKHSVSLPNDRTYFTYAKNGIAEGEFQLMHKDKIRSQGKYVNGLKHGIVYYYDEEGNVEESEIYEYGKMIINEK